MPGEGRGDAVTKQSTANEIGSIHEPDGEFAVDHVLKGDISSAVTVEVNGAKGSPTGGWSAVSQKTAADEIGPIHLPSSEAAVLVLPIENDGIGWRGTDG